MENVENQNVEARRSFLKKVAYVAPAVMALGALNAHAGTSQAASVFTGKTYVQPGDHLVGQSTVTGLSGPDIVEGGTYQIVHTDGTTGAVQSFTGAQVKQNDYGFFTWAKSIFASIMG